LSPVGQALLFLAAHLLLLCVSHTYNIRLAALVGKSSYSRLLPRNVYVYLTTPKNNSRGEREDNKGHCDCANGSIRVSVSTVATIPSSQIRKDHREKVSLWIAFVAVLGLILPARKKISRVDAFSLSSLFVV
jgi:hypothetical protein